MAGMAGELWALGRRWRARLEITTNRGAWGTSSLLSGPQSYLCNLGFHCDLPAPWLRACQRQHKVDSEVSTKGRFQVLACSVRSA